LIEYGFFRLIIAFVSIIPWSLLRFLSFISAFLFLLFPYRENVIRQNLKRCFPEKSDQEVKFLQKKYYQFLCRLFWESLKGFSISEDEARKRFHFQHSELVTEYLNQGHSVIGLAGHYGNWELGALSSGLFFSSVTGLYKPVKNKRIDRYIRQKRGKFGLQLGAIQHTYRIFAKSQKQPSFYLLVADQQPSTREKAIWVSFFKQDTPCLHGAEMFGKKYEMPVVFIDIQPQSFGYYVADISLLSSNPSDLQKGALTQKFMSTLENRIRQHPEYWLWSHKRWKWDKK